MSDPTQDDFNSLLEQWVNTAQIAPERDEGDRQYQIDPLLDANVNSTDIAPVFRSITHELDADLSIMPTTNIGAPITPGLYQPHAHPNTYQQQPLQQYTSVEPHNSRPGSSTSQVSNPNIFRSHSTVPPTLATESGPSTSSTAGGRGKASRTTSGPIRSSGRVTRTEQKASPYYRPSPASATVSFLDPETPHDRSGSSTRKPGRHPKKAKQAVRFSAAPAPIQPRAPSSAAASSSSSSIPSPIVQSSWPTAIPQPPELAESAGSPQQTFPPMASPQFTATGIKRNPSQSPPHALQPQTPPPQPREQVGPSQTATSSTIIRESYLPSHTQRPYTLNIPSDMHYSQSSSILHVSLELPGIKKKDVQIKLATCYFNHVKYVSVLAESSPVFEFSGAARGDQAQGSGTKPTPLNPDPRERKFGLLRRIIQVPSTTERKDIAASMEDGVLSLKIFCGKPYELDDGEVIPID